jgi:hypothetical protein
MQIPSSAIAASVATITSNSKAERTTITEAVVTTPIQVEQSGESSADRDAQGQGDGITPRDNRKKAQPVNELGNSDLAIPAPTLPDEPPSQLDLIG